jgi:hypothetical protein
VGHARGEDNHLGDVIDDCVEIREHMVGLAAGFEVTLRQRRRKDGFGKTIRHPLHQRVQVLEAIDESADHLPEV